MDVIDAALDEQVRLAATVVIPSAPLVFPATVAGLDVSYEVGSNRVAAAAVLVDIASGREMQRAVVHGLATFPYIPGLLAFREVEFLLEALAGLQATPGLLLCDGQGIAHPRRCGLASHLGVVTGLPSVGCAKSHYVGEYDEVGPLRGDRAPLYDGMDLVGEVLRTQDGVRPVFVSPGHQVSVTQASDLVLQLCSRYRLPDPVRWADRLSRQALR